MAMLTADENDLNNLANYFSIRHNNRKQRGDYNKAVAAIGFLRLPRHDPRDPARKRSANIERLALR